MITPIKRIPSETKLSIALDAIKQKQSITDISKHYNCSRTTVHQQKNIQIDAANKVFKPDDDEVLFYLPVTKKFILQTVLALYLICKSSYRDIQFFLQTIFNYLLSLGSVFNIVDEASESAIAINQSSELETLIGATYDDVADAI